MRHAYFTYSYNPGVISASDNIKCFILQAFSGNTCKTRTQYFSYVKSITSGNLCTNEHQISGIS